MSDFKWHRRFLKLAKGIASWSKDPNKRVGCILVDENNRLISTGFNGPPRGFDTFSQEDKLKVTIHAEINALLDASRPPITCYIYPEFPCSHCAAALAQSGIQRVVSCGVPSEKWRFDLTTRIFEEAKIETIQLSKSEFS